MSSTLEHTWELELPAGTPEQILAALAARDRLCGQSISLEPEEEPEKIVEVWLGTTDLLIDATFHLGIFAELTGPKDILEAARDAIEDIVGEQVEAAAADADQALLLETRPAADVRFDMVPEEDERPQLIVPEWLAPGEVDVPWSFRPFLTDGQAWPSELVLAEHQRLAVVPAGEEFRLYALPDIEDGGEEEHSHGDDIAKA